MTDEMETKQQKPQGSGCLKAGLIGCGVLFVLGLALGIYLVLNWESLAVSFGHKMSVTMVEESDLPEQEKNEIIAELDSLKQRYVDEEITGEDFLKVFEEIGKSPLMGLGIVFFADEQFIKPSGLTEDEKAEARLTVNRCARGVVEGKISEDEMSEATSIVFDEQSGLNDNITDEELRKMVADLKQLADSADIPEEDFKVDIAGEFRKAVKKALGE